MHPQPDSETLSKSNVAPFGSVKVYDKVVDSGPTELVDMEALNKSPAHKTALQSDTTGALGTPDTTNSVGVTICTKTGKSGLFVAIYRAPFSNGTS